MVLMILLHVYYSTNYHVLYSPSEYIVVVYCSQRVCGRLYA